MTFTRAQIADVCRDNAHTLPASLESIGINRAQLLFALSGNESTFGANPVPRHEPSWDIGGSFYAESAIQRSLVKEYGSHAACSYGPWQLAFFNFKQPVSPEQCSALEIAVVNTAAYLESLIVKHSLTTLESIGVCWNHGSPMAILTPGVSAYVAELRANYNVPLPNTEE